MIQKEAIDSLAKRFEKMKAEDLLSSISKEFGSRICFSSSLGSEDQVLTHMIATQKLPVDIFTLDTGRMFYESYELIEKTNQRYKINIRVVFPDAQQVEDMVNKHGINLFYHSIENRKMCCGVRKITPLQKALKGMDVWITGIRREQSPTRTEVKVIEWDSNNLILKINPLLNWSHDQVWDYIRENNIPYNSLHDKGYPSIGCQPCTREVFPGEDIRSGRWWWENPETKECGLHKK